MISEHLNFKYLLNRNWTGSLNDMMTITGAGGGGGGGQGDEDDEDEDGEEDAGEEAE
jgi:hypothetical protein